MKRQDVLNIARSWKEIPFRHQGRSGNGVDCIGFLMKIGEHFGIDDYIDDLTYGKHPPYPELESGLANILEVINFKDIKPADIVLMTIAIHPQHVGIIGDYSNQSYSLIHCHQKVNKVVEHRFAKIWQSKVYKAFRLPQLEDK